MFRLHPPASAAAALPEDRSPGPRGARDGLREGFAHPCAFYCHMSVVSVWPQTEDGQSSRKATHLRCVALVDLRCRAGGILLPALGASRRSLHPATSVLRS